MVLLTVTEAAKIAVDEFCRRKGLATEHDADPELCSRLAKVQVGGTIEHHELIHISRYLLSRARDEEDSAAREPTRKLRIDTLLRGATVYQAPPPPKPELKPEYKALMQRLKEEEEQRQYERMLNPPAQATETFRSRSPNAASFEPATSHGYDDPHEVDEVTFADVNRQMILIINILISIVCCSVAIWIAARRWSVPQRLGLSMSGSGLVAAAEVAIYMGYIRRIKSAKQKEVKKIETKEVVQTWIIDKSLPATGGDSVRFRKGKHR